MHTIKLIFFAILLLFFDSLFSQENISYENKIYKDGIKTILFHRAGVQFSYPIIDLGSDNKLLLEFDDLNEEQIDFSYTIIHCNYDWLPTNINAIEYIDGFEENIIEDYENSFNTLVPYRHYKLKFPNENIKPLISGNYILYVYEDYVKEKPILTRRFYVVDSKLKVNAKVKRPSIVNSINDSQEIVFSVYDIRKMIFNPLDNMKVAILQNNIEDIFIKDLKPDFIKGDVYEYINPQKLKFKGGNEYRYFNTKSTKYVNDRIASINYNEPHYVFELITERSVANMPYSHAQDINGELLVTAENINNDELEADYVYVDFNLKYFNDLKGDFYVFGALSDYEINENCKMYYDFGEKRYKLRMLLKQGFYNYQFVSSNNEEIDFSLIEGNYYETENNYVIYVYYKQQGSQYDELIAYKIINSVKEL